VNGAASQNGAIIEVRTEVGQGTSFELFFPLAAHTAAVRQSGMRAFSPGIPRGTETILLAEDEPCVLEVAATILRSLGYTVLPCLSGFEALKRAAEFSEPIHLLMTDVIMPGMDGKELALRLSAERPSVRILYASGYTENIITDKGLAKDGVEFLAKPYNPQVLGRKVREVLDAPV
jgi:CheY-like chemotaxis protein